MTQTKAHLEARVVALMEEKAEKWAAAVIEKSRADRAENNLEVARITIATLEGWQSCAREMAKRGSTNNFQHVTVCTGAKMVVK